MKGLGRLVIDRGMCLLVALVLAATVAAPSAAGAPVDHQMEMQAREAFAAGKFEEALTLFAKLYAQTLHPVYLRNIGRSHQKMHQPEPAIDSFKDYLAKAKKISDQERAEVEGYIHEMEALKEEQARAARPPVGPTTTPPPPPERNDEVTPPAKLVAQPPSEGGGSEGGNLLSKPPAPPRDEPAPVYKQWWFWTGIGVVVAGGVAAAILVTRKGSTCPADQCM